MLGLNDKGFFCQVSSDIYPVELVLSRTDDNGTQADYLDMDISANADGFFHSKLFDKRDGFSFKVINFPCISYSNIPSSPAYGIFISQILRLCRICNYYSDFDIAVMKLTHQFLDKGFDKTLLCKKFEKFVSNYEREWAKFGCLPELPTCLTR